MLADTTRSTPPWITINGGHDEAIDTGVAISGIVARWPCIALRADTVECAVPGGMPECITTALKRMGYRVTRSAAMLAPAESPATAMRARSTGYSRHTWSMALMIRAASP